MNTWKKWLTGVCCISVIVACNKDNGRDDTILDMSYVTGKYWYYNAWLGDRYGMEKPDLLEVLRFERGGTLKTMDYGGRREHVVGNWVSEKQQIKMTYNNGKEDVWYVLKNGDDYIEAIVNAQGERKYTTDLGYLGNLTADAFLVNEYTSGNLYQTRIGVDMRGNINIREGALIPSEGKNIPLENKGYYWCERKPVQGDFIHFDGTKREVRLYIRIGKDTHLKLQDTIYAENLPQRTPAEMDLQASRQSSGSLAVSWMPYSEKGICYRVEVLPQDMNVEKSFFVSVVQPEGRSGLDIKTNTTGEINKLGELVAGRTYVVRLTAILYEPDVDMVNDEYSYANIQAVTYFTRTFVW